MGGEFIVGFFLVCIILGINNIIKNILVNYYLEKAIIIFGDLVGKVISVVFDLEKF